MKRKERSPPKIVNLMFDEKTKIHKTLIKRETHSKMTRINTKIKTFYRFRNLRYNSLIHSLLQFLNHKNVNFYLIDYVNENNIDIKCLKTPFETNEFNAQSELMPIIPDNDEEDTQYEMITNEIFGHSNGDNYLIGNNVDFLNYVYLNENGNCL
jgi:hypothetical protein